MGIHNTIKSEPSVIGPTCLARSFISCIEKAEYSQLVGRRTVVTVSVKAMAVTTSQCRDGDPYDRAICLGEERADRSRQRRMQIEGVDESAYDDGDPLLYQKIRDSRLLDRNILSDIFLKLVPIRWQSH